MEFWVKFWSFFFFASLALFAGLAVVVTIGGFFDIRSMFKSMAEEAAAKAKKDAETTNTGHSGS